jgi:hypothetical protein
VDVEHAPLIVEARPPGCRSGSAIAIARRHVVAHLDARAAQNGIQLAHDEAQLSINFDMLRSL